MIEGVSPYSRKTIEYLSDIKKRRTCYEAILKRSFYIQLKDYSSLHCFGRGRIFILIGASSAGKSTFIQNFIDRY